MIGTGKHRQECSFNYFSRFNHIYMSAFRFQDLPKSFVSEFSFGAMACCITTYNVSLYLHHGITTKGAMGVITAAGIIFLGWIIWVFTMYLGGRLIIPMPVKAGRISEIINWLLCAIWILISLVPKVCHPGWAIASWCLWAVSVGYYIYSVANE